jgi:tetratricopeptide (TPR) repeat protein
MDMDADKILVISLLGSLVVGLLVALSSVCQIQYLTNSIRLEYKIRKNPNDITAYYNRAVLRRECNDNQGALEDFTQVIKIDPDKASAYHQRGRLRHRLGDRKGAIKDYQRAIEIYGRRGQLQNKKRVLDDLKRTQSAHSN